MREREVFRLLQLHRYNLDGRCECKCGAVFMVLSLWEKHLAGEIAAVDSPRGTHN